MWWSCEKKVILEVYLSQAYCPLIAVSSIIITLLLQGKCIFTNEVDKEFFTKASRTKCCSAYAVQLSFSELNSIEFVEYYFS